jgi:hypothetical protein
VFQDVSHQLSSINTIVNKEQLRQCLQTLVTFHVREQFIRLGDQVQSKLAIFQVIRQQLTDNEIIDIDNQLRQAFHDLRDNKITLKSIRHIESLVHTKAACLQCDDSASGYFNLAKALNHLLLCHLNNVHSVKRPFIHSITQMFKTLILSNTRLLLNRARTEYDDSNYAWFFLIYSVYQLQYWCYTPPDVYLNMNCYHAVINLLLFGIQCQKQVDNNDSWAVGRLFDILTIIPSNELNEKNDPFVQSVQWEILKIIVDECALLTTVLWRDDEDDNFRLQLDNLIKRNRLDVILLIYHRLEHVRCYFNRPNNMRQNVNMMTGSSTGRQLFRILLDEKPSPTWLTNTDLMFLLLKKKERQFFERLFKLSLFDFHQQDEDGNDLLLYACLKIRGCRHRIIEFLITMGHDLQKRNFNGVNFIDAIQLKQNRRVLDKLLEREIVKINSESGEIQVTMRSPS